MEEVEEFKKETTINKLTKTSLYLKEVVWVLGREVKEGALTKHLIYLTIVSATIIQIFCQRELVKEVKVFHNRIIHINRIYHMLITTALF